MTFDANLSFAKKLEYLRSLLDATFSRKEEEAALTPLHDANYNVWKRLKLGMSTTDQFAGDYNAEEKIVREQYENGPDGTKDVSALLRLSEIMEVTGRYSEGESMGREVLPWMQRHELLGKDSPQAISSMRHLASNIWKQERYEEGGEWLESCRKTVENMAKGKFGKYQDSERRQLEEVIKSLNKWKEDHDGK